MTITIPTKEPAQLRAGDTWRWNRTDLLDYPASAYTLTYRFKNAAGGFEIVADPSGNTYAVNVDATVTASFPAGNYDWQAQVDGPLGRFTVSQSSLIVLPSLFAGSATSGLDSRSTAKIALDAINAQLQKRATADQQEYEISVGGSMRRVVRATMQQLILAKQYYENLVANEEAAQRAADGLPDRRRSYVRFTCVR